MDSPLNKNSKMECEKHGTQKPAFVCKHLQYGKGLGFNRPEDDPAAEWPFENAWCDRCEAVWQEQGEGNDISEGFASITLICQGCFEDCRRRNSKHRALAGRAKSGSPPWHAGPSL